MIVLILDCLTTTQKWDITIKSFRRWVEDGYKIKKGSKALLLWGSPKKIKSKKNDIKIENQETEGSDFFPIAYVFSNLQVENK